MLRDERGFTLVELLAMLIIVGIIFSVVAYKFGVFTETATQQMIDHAIVELNKREKLVWHNLKLSFYEGDIDKETLRLMQEQHFNLGNGTRVSVEKISIQDLTADVKRAMATNKVPAKWSRR